MSKYLLLCTFSGREEDDQELWTNQWTVGVFEQLGTCYVESELDLKQVGTDSLEGRFNDDEQEEFEEELKNYLNQKVIRHRLENECKLFEPVLILSNDYWTDNHREIVNYVVIKVED